MENVNYFFGVDVSKATLDIAILKNGNVVLEQKIMNDKKDILCFFQQISKSMPDLTLKESLICLEHTGIYNNTILNVLQKTKAAICVESALQIKKSQGISRGKNDKIDARRIALYAFKNCKELTLWKPKRKSFIKLQSLISLRERLIKVRTQLTTPLQESAGLMDVAVLRALNAAVKGTLDSLRKDLKRIEKQLQELVESDPIFSKQVRLASSVPGIGNVVALNMILTTGEFEKISKAKSFACHAGVAPFEHASGTSVRGRTRVSKLANMNMKQLLHMASLSAIRCDQEIKTYYLRKVAQGKNKMSVLNAVRNKLITRVFACIKEERMFEKDFHHMLA